MSRRSKVNKKEWLTTDYYEILGVDESATINDIEEAYKYWVKVHHPDQHSTRPSAKRKAEQDTKRLNTAFAVLKDSNLRNEYDQVRNRQQAAEDTPSQPTPSYTNQTATRCNVRKTIGRPCSNAGLSQYGGRCARHARPANRPLLKRVRTLLAILLSLPFTVLLTLGLTDVEEFISVGESQAEEGLSSSNDASSQQPVTPTEIPFTPTEVPTKPIPTPGPTVSTPELDEDQYRDDVRERLQALDSAAPNGDPSGRTATDVFFAGLHHDLPQGQPSRVIDTYVHQARLELAARQVPGATTDWEKQASRYLKAYYLNPQIILCCLNSPESLPTYTGTHIHLRQEYTLEEISSGNLLGNDSSPRNNLASPPQLEHELSQAIDDLVVGHVLTSEDPILGPVLFLISAIATNHSSSDYTLSLTGCAFVPLHTLTEGYFATYQAYTPSSSTSAHVILGMHTFDSNDSIDPVPVASSGITLTSWQCAAY